EELLLQEDARGSAIRIHPLDVAEDRPALCGGDLLESAPHVDALHLGERRGVKRRGERALGAAPLDVLLDSAPALQLGHLKKVLPRPRGGILGVCGHLGSSSHGAIERFAGAAPYAAAPAGRERYVAAISPWSPSSLTSVGMNSRSRSSSRLIFT